MNTPLKRRWLRASAYSVRETLLLVLVDAGLLMALVFLGVQLLPGELLVADKPVITACDQKIEASLLASRFESLPGGHHRPSQCAHQRAL